MPHLAGTRELGFLEVKESEKNSDRWKANSFSFFRLGRINSLVTMIFTQFPCRQTSHSFNFWNQKLTLNHGYYSYNLSYKSWDSATNGAWTPSFWYFLHYTQHNNMGIRTHALHQWNNGTVHVPFSCFFRRPKKFNTLEDVNTWGPLSTHESSQGIKGFK